MLKKAVSSTAREDYWPSPEATWDGAFNALKRETISSLVSFLDKILSGKNWWYEQKEDIIKIVKD